MELNDLAHRYEPRLIELRRELHRIPELAYREKKTAALVAKELESMGLKPEFLLETGIVATIEGTKGDKDNRHTVALRADMDALAEFEETGVEYSSIHEGKMHACGHDCHMACLLTAARILVDMKDELNGNVKLIFQPGEEGAKGAQAMIKAGALKDVEAIFGLHVWGNVESGKASCEDGPVMAAADWFKIRVEGKGCHGSRPHEGRDAIMAAAALVWAINNMVAREIDPLETAVVSVCEFHAGHAINVLPENARLAGTIRSFTPQMRAYLPKALKRLCKGIGKAYRVNITCKYTKGNGPVINDRRVAKVVRKTIEETLGEENRIKLGRITPGEDFSAYLEYVPGAFMILGISNDEACTQFPNHSSHFNVDESALISGTKMHAQFAINMLDKLSKQD